MFRDGTGSGTNCVAVVETPNNQVDLQWRDTAGADSTWNGSHVGDTVNPKWVKLVRSGNTFSGYYAATSGTPSSSDWVQIDSSHVVSMSAPTVGLAVTAGDNTQLCAGTFTNVAITGQWVQGTVADFSAGSHSGTVAASGGGVQLASSSVSGIYTSVVFDAARAVTWGAASWTASVPAGTTLVVETRSGNTATPDGSWSDWAAVTNGQTIASPPGRYFQYRVKLASTGISLTPVLFNIIFLWS